MNQMEEFSKMSIFETAKLTKIGLFEIVHGAAGSGPGLQVSKLFGLSRKSRRAHLTSGRRWLTAAGLAHISVFVLSHSTPHSPCRS